MGDVRFHPDNRLMDEPAHGQQLTGFTADAAAHSLQAFRTLTVSALAGRLSDAQTIPFLRRQARKIAQHGHSHMTPGQIPLIRTFDVLLRLSCAGKPEIGAVEGVSRRSYPS